jgi:hypothetical protein
MVLDQWNCVSLFHETTITVASDMELYTDASSTMGFGGFFRKSWFCDKGPSDLPNEGDEKLSMANLNVPNVLTLLQMLLRLTDKKQKFCMV